MIIGNPLLLKKAADSTPAEDPVVRSLRFESGGRLTRTFSSSNRKTFTISFWAKRGSISSSNDQQVFSVAGSGHLGGADIERIHFTNDDTIEFWSYPSSTAAQINVSAKLRDPSAWAHYMMSVDTTQSTASDRIKFFINGVHQTALDNSTYPSQNYEFYINSNETHYIGEEATRHRYPYSGLLADFYFIDGTALSTPVGNLIEDTGYSSYKPKAFDMSSYSGNSCHIDAQPAHDADLLVTSVGRNDGDTTFADAAAGHTLTTGGDPEHSIAVSNPFTGDDRAIYFDGSGDKIETGTTTDFNFGTGDFTIECWINPSQSGSQYEGLIASDNYGGSGARWTVYQNYSNIQFWGYNSSGSYVSTTTSSVLTVGQWHHIAVTRESGTLKIYVNGVEEQSSTSYSSYDFSDDTGLRLGNSYGSFSYQGYMYDARVVNGTAITPPSGGPTSKLTAVTNTKLLLQPDKDDSSWGDESGNQTLTGSGDLSTVSPTASTPYDAAAKSTAMYFDGSGDYLQTSTSSDLTFGTGDFTVEIWFYPTTVDTSTSYKGIISDELYSSTGGWAVSQRDDELSLWIKNTGGSWVSFVADGALTANQWQHIAVSYDSSTTTTRLFVDGTSVVSGTTSGWNLTGDQIEIGRSVSGQEITGYLFDSRATKGTARYTSNFTAPTAPFELNPVYIGADQSGNKNHFTPTNISMHDVMLDTPSKNYSVLNILQKAGSNGSNPSEGNLSLAGGSNPSKAFSSTIAVNSGKYYAEFYLSSLGYPSVSVSDTSLWVENYGSGRVEGNGSITYDVRAATGSGDYFINATSGSGALSLTPSAGDIIQVAFDADTRKVWFGRNGTWNGSGDPANGTNNVGVVGGTDALTVVLRSESGTTIAGFGADPTFANNKTSGQDTSQSEFYYAPPTGFKSLNTSNLDDPTVTPSEHFGVLTYTGNSDTYNDSGSTQNVTGVNFDVGMAWIKDRDNSAESSYTGSGSDEYGNYLFDTVTGTSTGGYNIDLDVNYSGAGPSLNSGYYGVTSFSAGSGTNRGITVDEAGETNFNYDDGFYQLNERYVAWLWKLGSTGSSSTWNSSYTAPSTEHYNASAGVTTIQVSPASSGNLEVAHSLSAAPEFFWVADDQGYANFSGYPAFHKDLDSGKYLLLDSTSAQSSDSTYFPSGAAHADYIKLGSAFIDDYGYGFNLRIWAFTGVEGYSKFGSFVGNGSSDGTMVYTGFRPALVMVKSMGTQRWAMIDSVRGPINPNRNTVYAEDSTTEYSGTLHDRDFLSNGFKLRNTDGIFNTNDQKYLYCAWAEQPFSAPSNAR